MRSAARWLALLFLVSAGILLGATAHGQGASAEPTTTLPSTSPSVSASVSTSSTTSPTGGQHTPYAATFSPCTSDGTQDGSEPCNQTPANIQVVYPTGAPPDQVTINWAASGRSAAAPDPDTTSVTLTAAQGTNCGTDLMCWPWPTAMNDGSFILNGTYQLVVCPFGNSHDGQCSQTLPPQSVGLAVTPGPPTSVSAQSVASEVTVSWKAPAQAPPDLVGYAVSRGNSVIYTCSTDDLGPGASTPCPTGLEVADHPGDGEYTYSVTALRLGVDDAAANVVSSAAAVDGQGVVTVPGHTAGQGGGAPTGSGSGPGTQVPLSGGNAGSGPVPLSGAGGGNGTQVTLGQVSASSQTPGASSPPVPKLSYPTASGVGPAHPQALSLKVDTPKQHEDVVPVAVLALGILSLAVAAHFLYLRVELGVVQARLAARRATGI